MSAKNTKDLIALERELAHYEGEDRVVTSLEVYHSLKAKQSDTKDRLLSIHPKLMEYLKGFWPGEVTVLSGPTKNGKTLSCQTFTYDFAVDGKRSLWFTFEVPALQFLEQFGEKIPGFYMPQQLKSNSLDWINQRVCETKLKYGLDAVFIDHLHFLIDMSRHNISLEIGHVMRYLKKMAIYHRVHVFLVAHLAKVKLDKEPDETDLRDSSFVGQECDNCLMIWRLKKDPENKSVCSIVLNRRFGVMGKKIVMKKIGNYLREVELDRD